MQRSHLSIIIPCLNESGRIGRTLRRLESMRGRGVEVVVCDGGSTDDTATIARESGVRVMAAERGRASQMNAGAKVATGGVFLFVHADSLPPVDADEQIHHALDSGHAWGRFDTRIEGSHPMLRVVGAMMNIRSRVTSIATGDQGIFATRAAFEAAGGYPAIPLMEDVALSKRLRSIVGRAACPAGPMTTSGRRWEARGVWSTIFLMWRFRLQYALGKDPRELAREYHRKDCERGA